MPRDYHRPRHGPGYKPTEGVTDQKDRRGRTVVLDLTHTVGDKPVELIRLSSQTRPMAIVYWHEVQWRLSRREQGGKLPHIPGQPRQEEHCQLFVFFTAGRSQRRLGCEGTVRNAVWPHARHERALFPLNGLQQMPRRKWGRCLIIAHRPRTLVLSTARRAL